jgi:hypothetical protein
MISEVGLLSSRHNTGIDLRSFQIPDAEATIRVYRPDTGNAAVEELSPYMFAFTMHSTSRRNHETETSRVRYGYVKTAVVHLGTSTVCLATEHTFLKALMTI